MADTKISSLTELTVPPDPTDELVVVDKSDTSMAASGTDKRIQYSNLYDWAEAGDLSVIEPDDAAAAGTSVEHARADHQHAVAAATAGTIQPDDAAAEGSATSFARSDHKHSIDAATAATLTGTNAEGSSTSFARADHNHAFPWAGTVFGAPPPAGPVASGATGAITLYWALQVQVLRAATLAGVRYRVGATSNGQVRCALFDSVGTTKVADRTTNSAQATANTIHSVAFDGTYAAAPGTYYAVLWFSSATATFFGGRHLVQVEAATSTAATPTSLTVAVANADVPVMTTY